MCEAAGTRHGTWTNITSASGKEMDKKGVGQSMASQGWISVRLNGYAIAAPRRPISEVAGRRSFLGVGRQLA